MHPTSSGSLLRLIVDALYGVVDGLLEFVHFRVTELVG